MIASYTDVVLQTTTPITEKQKKYECIHYYIYY